MRCSLYSTILTDEHRLVKCPHTYSNCQQSKQHPRIPPSITITREETKLIGIKLNPQILKRLKLIKETNINRSYCNNSKHINNNNKNIVINYKLYIQSKY